LHRIAKSVALHNLLHEGVVASAVCLLELCSLDTEMLRVDVQAARRIYDHMSSKEKDLFPCSAVIDLFIWPNRTSHRLILEQSSANLNCKFEVLRRMLSSHNSNRRRNTEQAMGSPALLTSLRMLEEATWALDPHPASSATAAAAQSSAAASTYDSPWHLYGLYRVRPPRNTLLMFALFCRVHALPRSLTLLHELARSNDWVMFLHESDLQECPPETVLDVIDGYFTDLPLQSHLRINVSSM
ncbi:unnamed protein product, partial [Amoebophrya sp. A25]